MPENLYTHLAVKYGVERWRVKEILFAFRYGRRNYTDEELEQIFVSITGLVPVEHTDA